MVWDRFSRLFFETVSEKQWLAHILCTAYKSQPCEPTSLNLGNYGQGTVSFLIRTGINMGQGKEKRLELLLEDLVWGRLVGKLM